MNEPTVRIGMPRLLGRALLLHCPRCGHGGILRSWFNLRQQCPTCQLVFNRGEKEDYWLGGYTVNFIAAEIFSLLMIVGLILATLPHVPWGVVLYGGLAMAALTPILFFPFSRTLWLALDLYARPSLRGDRARRPATWAEAAPQPLSID